MRAMAVGLFIFLSAIGWATILESKYDIQTAKIIVYNALWFEILLLYLGINLIANIFRYRMFQRQKMAMLSFHLAFLIILLGAGITRFFSFEGLMMIREGESSNFIYLSDPHLFVRIHDDKMQYTFNDKKFLSEETNNDFETEVLFPGHRTPITISYVNFQKKLIDSLVKHDSIPGHVLEIVSNGMNSNYLSKGKLLMVGDVPLSYEIKDAPPGIELIERDGETYIQSKLPIRYLPMSIMQAARQSGMELSDSLYQQVPTDSAVPLLSTTLYQCGGQQFVYKQKLRNTALYKLPSGKKDQGLDRLTLKVTDGNKSKIVHLDGGMNAIPNTVSFQFEGLDYAMEYGSTVKEIPFTIVCRDFQLDRYPGSQSASSYASELTLIDEKNDYTKNKRIFMNHVMDYQGYRLFQSSYELDNPATPENEEGTKLSVNYDFWGTNITYLGYLLMGVGMLMSLFAPVGRFRELLDKIKKSRARRESKLGMIALLLCFNLFNAQASGDQHQGHDHEHSTEEHAHEHESRELKQHFFLSDEHEEQLSSLLVQDFQGRIIPMHTLCDQLLRKVHGSSKYEGHGAIQSIMSVHMYPPYWIEQKFIKVPKALRERLKLDKYASFQELVNRETGAFKWIKEYESAHQKLESRRSEFDKKLIKLVERFEVFSAFLSWSYLKIMPVMDEQNNTWFSPFRSEFAQRDSLRFVETIKYLDAIHQASKNGNWAEAEQRLTNIKREQREIAKDIVPSESHVNMEIRYNKMNIFKNSMYLYLCIGFILLIIFFLRVFIEPTVKSEKRFRKISLPFMILIGITFVYHGAGLIMRWYISGHAPWSNGYEAVVFIAWVSMLAGFVFSRKNPVIIAGTAILAFLMIFVTELNLLDPEITPLQPVLKSYWLMIHVAIITGSYGFLGLGAILGLLNLNLYIFRSPKNGERISAHINEITYVSELTITLGLFMLTIGTFLGGVWANESWGRYWGWDPKETWALVSVLVYAIVLHLRYIPGLNGKFTFNLVSLWAYGAILFTFFGVNFYLVGLHSYAQGEGLAEVPTWIYTTVGIFALYSLISYIRFRNYRTKNTAL